MYRRLAPLFLAAAIAAPAPASPAPADPGVVVSIKPIHSLVAGVMAGVGTPHLIVSGGDSPHTHALRPSAAAALQRARVVFWVGIGLERFLAGPLETLAKTAAVVALADAPGLSRLEFRDSGPWPAHAPAGAGERGGDGHAHGHGATDMHLWLDPANANAMVREIVRVLSGADAGNAGQYAANGQALSARLDRLTASLEKRLAAIKDKPFVVFHDAFQYLERRFSLNAVGAVTVSPDIRPGARRLAEIRATIARLGALCVFAEPQFEPRLVRVLTEGTEARTGVLDPVGADIADGPDLYFTLMERNVKALTDCLAGEG